jgi:hypothetical protein
LLRAFDHQPVVVGDENPQGRNDSLLQVRLNCQALSEGIAADLSISRSPKGVIEPRSLKHQTCISAVNRRDGSAAAGEEEP